MDFFVKFVNILMQGFAAILRPLVELFPDLIVVLDFLLFIGAVLAVLGLIFTFCGHKMEKLLLRLGFLVAGFYIGMQVAASILPDNAYLPLIIGLVVGILLAIFEPFLLKFFFFTIITYASATFLQPLFLKLFTEDAHLALLLAIAVGILVSFLAIYVILPVFLSILVAGVGAYFFGTGLAIGFGEMIFNAIGSPTYIIITVLTGVLFLLGVILNFRAMARAKDKKAAYHYEY